MAGEWATEEAVSVNALENFWRQLKCFAKGMHIGVSATYLERYAKEFESSFNRQSFPETMLHECLSAFPLA